MSENNELFDYLKIINISYNYNVKFQKKVEKQQFKDDPIDPKRKLQVRMDFRLNKIFA